MFRIELDQLSKEFQTGVKALDAVSLRVKAGEIYGLVGLNGAGKTTLMRCLLGILRPRSGSCFLNGTLINRKNHEVFHRVGYMIERPLAYPELTVRENLQIFAELRLQKDFAQVDRVIEQMQLTAYEKRKAKYLSLGNKQRLGLAKALMHDPDILLLDEPLNGLDPKGRKDMRDLFVSLADGGVSILISSHLLPEITNIASRIGILHGGKLLEERSASLPQQLFLQTLHDERAEQVLEEAGYRVSLEKDGIYLRDEFALRYPEEITKFLVHHGLAPRKLLVVEEDLEDYFLRLTRGV